MDESMNDDAPDTQPDGALIPPPRRPPTAIATAAPLPPRRPDARFSRQEPRGLRALITRGIDRLDALGDRIAAAVGLR